LVLGLIRVGFFRWLVAGFRGQVLLLGLSVKFRVGRVLVCLYLSLFWVISLLKPGFVVKDTVV